MLPSSSIRTPDQSLSGILNLCWVSHSVPQCSLASLREPPESHVVHMEIQLCLTITSSHIIVAMQKEAKLKLAIVLSTGFLLVEVIGGYIANSLAIYSDAAHLLTDIAGFAISLVAVIFAKRPGCKDYTYGLLRAEIFGALASILSLWVITAILVFEAYYRALSWTQGKAEYVNGKLMFFVALFGVGVNLCLGLVFSSEHGGDLILAKDISNYKIRRYILPSRNDFANNIHY
jgi:cation diffusion facilitator family transporter